MSDAHADARKVVVLSRQDALQHDAARHLPNIIAENVDLLQILRIRYYAIKCKVCVKRIVIILVEVLLKLPHSGNQNIFCAIPTNADVHTCVTPLKRISRMTSAAPLLVGRNRGGCSPESWGSGLLRVVMGGYKNAGLVIKISYLNASSQNNFA